MNDNQIIEIVTTCDYCKTKQSSGNFYLPDKPTEKALVTTFLTNLKEKGWWVSYSNGKALCPKCII